MNQKKALIILTILVAFPNLCQCDANLRDYWPTKNWKYSQPEKQGLQTNKIISMGEYILTNIPTMDSVIIVRHGYIIFEQYFKKSSEDLRVLQSVTKSVVSSLLGIAIDLGLVKNLDQKMIDFFPECNDSSVDSSIREITLHNLVTMSASFTALPDPNFLKDVFTLPLVRKPGTHFHYDAPDPELISLIISKVSSFSAADFAYKYLFRPIGIKEYSWHGSKGYSHGHLVYR